MKTELEIIDIKDYSIVDIKLFRRWLKQRKINSKETTDQKLVMFRRKNANNL